jgi:RimJ/RimL family protein N-acetyltransferase
MANTAELLAYRPGALGRIIELHGTYYAKHWGLGLYFEAKVATEMAEFLSRFDAKHDGVWFAQVNEKIIGSIFIDGSQAKTEGARLRWFILDPEYQGLGVGQQLIETAMRFCRQKQFQRIYLTTFEGLTAARHLYEKHGFKLCGEEDGSHLTGNSELTEQIFEYLPAGSSE